jgi:hypothetical protein
VSAGGPSDAGPPPPENPELAAALAATGGGVDPADVGRVEALLLSSTLIAPVAPATSRDRSEVALEPPGADGGLDLVAALRPIGETSLLAFTGLDSFTRWSHEHPFVAAGAVALCGFVLERDLSSLWLDAAGPASVAISGPELRAIAAGRHPRAEQGSPQPPGAPRQLEPLRDPALPALTAALAPALAAHAGVDAGYLLEGGSALGRRQLVVGLRMTSEGTGSFRAAAEDACAAVAGALPEGWIVNAVAL